MLILLMAIIAALAWQALDTVKTQERAAREVLQGYSQMIADEFGRALEVGVGFRGMFQLSQRLRGSTLLAPGRGAWSADEMSQILGDTAAGQIAWALAVDQASDEITVLFGEPGHAIDQLGHWQQSAPIGDDPFYALHHGNGDHTETLIMMPLDEGSRLLSLGLAPGTLQHLFEQVYTDHRLLPPALAGDAELRSHVVIQVTDASGSQIFRSPAPLPAAAIAADSIIAGDYAGLFKGFVVSAGIDPAIAGQLIIGGLPYGRTALIAWLVLLAALLALASVVVIRRDRKLMALREDFIARVSHELRTPLTQIRMFAESLSLDRLKSKAQQHNALSVINRETLRLERMVDNILQFSKPRRPILPDEPAPYAARQLLEQIGHEFEPLLAARHTRLEIHCPRSLNLRHNREGLTQILINLLDNALKYGPKGQTISIDAGTTDDHATIAVCDDGPGVPAKERRRVFTPYYRLAREQQRAIAGTGIGLSVATDLAAALGATLRLVPQSDRGACFELRLTLANADA